MSRRSGCLIAVALLFALVSCGVMTMSRGGDIAVPQVAGKTLDYAEILLVQEGLRLGKIEYDPDADPPHGIVIRQNPRANAFRGIGNEVDVLVAGPQLVRVPGVLRKTEDEAREEFDDAEVRCGPITRVHNDYIPAGQVISQDPAWGTRVPKDSKVKLVMSLGPDSVRIPGIVGLWERDARGFLARLGLQVRIDERHDARVAGVVVEQEPAPGTEMPLGEDVRITISLGPRIVAVPRLLGMTAEEAADSLREAGFIPRLAPPRSLPPVDTPRGTVYEQRPDPRTQLAEGAVVNYSVFDSP